MRPKGLLSPALFVDGIKAGIDLVNIESQERRHLATPKNKGSTPTHHWSPSETPGWIFDSKTMLWGNRVLKSLSSCDLLFIDELGPIEFHSDTGLAAGMDLIGQRAYQNAFVVIRPSLVPEAQERWPWARLMDITGLMIKPDDLVK